MFQRRAFSVHTILKSRHLGLPAGSWIAVDGAFREYLGIN